MVQTDTESQSRRPELELVTRHTRRGVFPIGS